MRVCIALAEIIHVTDKNVEKKPPKTRCIRENRLAQTRPSLKLTVR